MLAGPPRINMLRVSVPSGSLSLRDPSVAAQLAACMQCGAVLLCASRSMFGLSPGHVEYKVLDSVLVCHRQFVLRCVNDPSRVFQLYRFVYAVVRRKILGTASRDIGDCVFHKVIYLWLPPVRLSTLHISPWV